MNKLFFLGSLLLTIPPCTAGDLSLKSDEIRVRLDTAFPRIIDYTHRKSGAVIQGQPSPASKIIFNGELKRCAVTLKKIQDNQAAYTIQIPSEKVSINLQVTVENKLVEMAVTKVEESGASKLKSFAFPDNALLTFSSNDPKAAIATTFMTARNDSYKGEFREKIAPLSEFKPATDTGNYFFMSTTKLAAGIASNHVVDIDRISYSITDAQGVKTCQASLPLWQYREIDSETLDLPKVKIFITDDLNNDGEINWQDSALVYKRNMPKPFGYEYVKDTVGENIAMNFASGAQQPFLRTLDEIKKISLATDGLGNQVILKGFSSEGHDSANTDYSGNYNTRAGGLKDLQTLTAEAEKYNCRVGLHINASEVYPEANRYDPEILAHKDGQLSKGWLWLDRAIMIDKHKDTVKGDLFRSLEQMRKDLPDLDFLYVDTYWENGWTGWKLAKKLNKLGFPMYTEGNWALDPWTTWSHARRKNSRIATFLWFSDCDNHANYTLLRGGRNDKDGYMGWQNKHNFNTFVHHTFTSRISSKYLQHFELLSWKENQTAIFNKGLKITKEGSQIKVVRDGRLIMTWNDKLKNHRMFIPWNPLSEKKIYIFDEVGSEITWKLPASWKSLKTAYLYQLDEKGRQKELAVTIDNESVTLTPKKNTPYVLYPQKSPTEKILTWGEGGLIKDPGFDSYGFNHWDRKSSRPDLAHIAISNDSIRNARLVVTGEPDAEISQKINNLKPGQSYSASVWVQIKGKRKTSFSITPDGSAKPQTFSAEISETNIKHGMPNDRRAGSNYQRLKVTFKMPTGSHSALIQLKTAKGNAQSMVEFDDIRLLETNRSPEAANHWFYEDFENVDMGYGPFSSCFDERTHLSETNKPYTKDTINGKFSLKTRDASKGIRTLPSRLPFHPNTRYKVVLQTLGSSKTEGSFNVFSGGKSLSSHPIKEGRHEISFEFTSADSSDTYLELVRTKGDHLVIDDLAIDLLDQEK